MGVVGSGFIAAQHVRAWKFLGVDVVIHGGRSAAPLADQLGCDTADSFEELVAQVDAVDICTPTDTHVSYAIRAAEAGRHVLCEKPLALDPTEAATVVRACERAGVRLSVSHVVRYFDEYMAALEAVAEGRIGDVALVRLARESFAPDRAPGHWLYDERRSGGIIGDLMSHDIDYALRVAGPVHRVFARALRAQSHEVDDHAYVVLTHDTGALTHLTASWTQVRPRFRTRIEIAGSAGLLAYDSEQATTLALGLHLPAASEHEVGLPDAATRMSANNPFVRQFREFITSTRAASATGSKPSSAGVERDAVGVVAVIAAALESNRDRRAVTIEGGLR